MQAETVDEGAGKELQVTIPLVCIPIALAIIYLSKIPVAKAMAKQPEGYDNRHPRDQQAKLSGWGKRALAAHMNGFEAFPAFAAGVLVAHVGHADPKWSTILAVGFVVARTIYPMMYIANVDKARSGVWFLGLCCSMGLMILPCLS